MLIVAMLLAALISVALVSYLKLSNNSLKVSQRVFLQNSAMNLAEMGIERALTSFNHSVNGEANAWAGWTINGTAATRTISGFVPAPGATGVIKLYVQNQNSGSTTTIAPDDHSWDDHSSDHESEHEESGHSEVASIDFASPALGAIDRLAYQTRTIRHLATFAAGGVRAVWHQPVLISLAAGIRPVASLAWAGGLPVLATLGGTGDSDDDHSYSDDHLSDNHGADNHSDDDHDTPSPTVSTPVTSSTILIVAKAIITPNDGSSPFVKMIEVQVAQRSTWGYGLVGRSSVSLDSNATADSWSSDPDNDPATAVVPYSSTVRRDNGTVGVVSAANDALSLGSNASIYGTVNTGGGTITYDSNVRVYSATSPASPKVDPSRVHRDFKFTFPAISEPTPTVTNPITVSVTNNRTFPDTATDHPNPADGKYYYVFADGTEINLDSNKNLTIADKVVWIFRNHNGAYTIQTSSNADFLFSGTTSTLDIYTNGNIKLDSNCDINSGGQPSRFKIYGTNPSTQSLVMSSNATISGVLYSPNASYSIDSNCRLYGSVVANSIHMDSQAAFHYDEALGLFGSGNPFRVSSWRELKSAAERDAYATQFNF
ncbi:MAG: hypothetical protein HYV95_03895 [Opitutae bacterium]|nr:hypothetical protein [Opitutae bacterium]